MRNLLRIGFIIIAFTFVFGVNSVIEVNAQRNTEILKRVDAHYKWLQSLQSDITMEKYNAQLNVTDDPSVGKIKYVPKTAKNVMFIRVDWSKPIEEYMSVRGDDYTIYRPRLKQVYEGKTSAAKNSAKAGNALSFLSMSRKEISDNYTIRDLGDEIVKGGTQTFHIELTPKNAANYKLAHLWVDKNGMPVMAKIVEKNNDTTTVFLSNITENAKLDGRVFIIEYPKSIKPIR